MNTYTCDVYEYNDIALITLSMAYLITWMHRLGRIAQKNKFHGKGPNDMTSNLYNKSKILIFLTIQSCQRLCI
jgi:hypothetical protein